MSGFIPCERCTSEELCADTVCAWEGYLTAAPAEPVGGTLAPGDEVLDSYKLAERCVKPSSMYGTTAQQLARALLTSKEMLTDFAESYEAMKTRAKNAEREVAGLRKELAFYVSCAQENVVPKLFDSALKEAKND